LSTHPWLFMALLAVALTPVRDGDPGFPGSTRIHDIPPGGAAPASQADSPSVRDFGATCDGETDDGPAIARASKALRDSGRTLHVPGDCRIRLGEGAQIWLRGMRLAGNGAFEPGGPEPHGYGARGGTILLDGGSRSPLVVSSGWAITGLVFHWPRQTEASAVASKGAPISFPPLISSHGDDAATFWDFSGNQVENAYDVIDLTKARAVGHFHFEHNLEFALRYHLRFRSAGGEGFVTDNQFSPAAFQYGVLGAATTVLRDFAAAHAEVVRAEGDGTLDAVASTAVEGLRLSGNYGFGLRYGLHAAGGTFNLATLVADSWDQVATPISVTDGGAIVAATVSGGTWLCQQLGHSASAAPCVEVDGGAPGSSLSMANVSVPVVAGPGIVFHDSGNASLTVTGGSLSNVGNVDVGNPHGGIDFEAPLGTLVVAGTLISTTSRANSGIAVGIKVRSARASSVVGVVFAGWAPPLRYDALAGAHSVSGNVSYGSTSSPRSPALAGPGASRVSSSANDFDAGPQTFALQAPAGQHVEMTCGGDDPDVDCGIRAKGRGKLTVESSAGRLFSAGPGDDGPQMSHPEVRSAPAGSAAIYSADSGNVQLSAPPGGLVLIRLSDLPPCSPEFAGYLCAGPATPAGETHPK